MSASFAFASALLVMCGLATAGSAMAACRLVATPVPELRIDHDPFAWAVPVVPLRLALRNDGDATCDVQARMQDLSGSPIRDVMLGDGMSVSLVEHGAVPQDADTPFATASIAPGAEVVVDLETATTTTGMTPAGDRRAQAWVVLRDAAGGDLERMPLTVSVRTSARAEATVSGGNATESGTVGTVDFGELVLGDERRLVVRMRANTQSRLTVSSTNSGRLRPIGEGTALPMPDEGVPYEIRIAGDAVDMRTPWSSVLPMPDAPEGTALRMDIRIGDPTGHPAGRYGDVITIEGSPL